MNLKIYFGFTLFLSFYISYLLKNFSLKGKNIKVNVLLSGEKSKKTLFVEFFIVFCTYSMIFVQVLSLFNFIKSFYENKYQDILGILICSTGVFFFIAAIISMGKSWRAGIDFNQDTSLKTDGVLKISRNPAFLGFNLFYLGFTLMFLNFFTVLLTLMSFIAFHLQILEEESFLEKKFGISYNNYKNKVKRYF